MPPFSFLSKHCGPLFANKSMTLRLLEEGRRVVIVEGGEESSLDALMTFAQSAGKFMRILPWRNNADNAIMTTESRRCVA